MRRPEFQQLLSVFVLLISAMGSYAADPMIIDINEGIEEMPFETGDVDKDITSSFVETIFTSDIPKTQTNLGELIKKNSGIKIRQSSGNGSYSLASIRGKSADQVLVYLDGILLNNGAGGGVDLSLIPINEVASIEIYKDIIPIEFAEASNGGVINIKTHRHSHQNLITATHLIGSFSTIKSDVLAKFNKDRLSYVYTFGHMTSKNNFTYTDKQVSSSNPLGNNVVERENNNVKQTNFMFRSNYDLSEKENLTFQTEYFEKKKHLPTNRNLPTDTENISNRSKHIKTQYINNYVHNTDLKLKLGLSYNDKLSIFDNRKKGIGVIKRYDSYITENFESSLYFNFTRNNIRLISNTVLRQEIFKRENLLQTTEEDQRNVRHSLTSAFEGNLHVMSGDIILSPAIRHQLTYDRISGYISTKNGRTDAASAEYSVTSPQFGVLFKPNSNLSIKANIAKYYRLPSYIELFGSKGFIGANDELKPEEGVNSDYGFNYIVYPASQKLTKINWKSAIFYSEINNEIVFSTNSQGVSTPNNTENSEISGFESQLLIELFYDFEISNNLTLLRPYHYTKNNIRYFLPGRPLTSIATTISTTFNSLVFYIEHIKDSEMYFDTVNGQPAGNKEIINVGGSFHRNQLTLDWEVNNIFGNEYKDYFFKPAPGRSIQLSARYTFI